MKNIFLNKLDSFKFAGKRDFAFLLNSKILSAGFFRKLNKYTDHIRLAINAARF